MAAALDVPHDPLALDIVRQPLPQPGPLPRDGFVRQLERLLIAGDQARVHQPVYHARVGIVDRDGRAVDR